MGNRSQATVKRTRTPAGRVGRTPTRLRDLSQDPQNARRHGDRNVGAIVSALQEVGAGRSIVIDEAGVILAGNATVEAAGRAGITKLHVVDTDGDAIVAVRRRGLTPSQKARLALFDNRSGELAEGWNPEVLEELRRSGVSLDGLWSDEELAALFATDGAEEPAEGHTDPDDVSPPRSTTIQAGQVFELGPHRLICGDAQEASVVAQVLGREDIDLVVTSPPYNVGMKYRTHQDTAEREAYLGFIRAVGEAFVARLRRGRFVAWNLGVSPKTYAAHQVVTLEACGLDFYRQIVWQKAGVAYPIFQTSVRTKRVRHYKPNYTHETIQVFERPGHGDVELVPCALCDGSGHMAAHEIPSADGHETVQLMVFGAEEPGASRIPDGRYRNDIWPIAQSQATVGLRTIGMKSTTLTHRGKAAHTLKEHPAPFPVELPRVCLGVLTGPDEVVFDPFGGSGSTLIACEQLHRRGRLIEIDPVYCQIVIDRWEAFTGSKAVKVA